MANEPAGKCSSQCTTAAPIVLALWGRGGEEKSCQPQTQVYKCVLSQLILHGTNPHAHQ